MGGLREERSEKGRGGIKVERKVQQQGPMAFFFTILDYSGMTTRPSSPLQKENQRKNKNVPLYVVQRGSSAVECRTRNQVSTGSNPPLLPFRRLGIFVLSIEAPLPLCGYGPGL